MDISWIYHGDIMGISWRYHGYIMDISWIYHGYIMDISWIYHGYTPYYSHPPVKKSLDSCRESLKWFRVAGEDFIRKVGGRP
jgi:hypothetical protein